ncbi:type I-B CRISPR-associated protein Cas7/Csh2 [Thermatribacter velox]|jgi:CRISPR-associated protein Csh2|uniref:Type I-B CRISPR-associated protein Cas7/Csh2 n=1 Tax=Thermatribacter velox TaxID=3039681 RepID=A0ABZ2YDZ0_9BACT|nr:CRISPR-associated protein Csh2 [Candidatus Atribacteria bacterium]
MNTYGRNSEILFLYDAKMTNPNGDPDDENKPRMDYEKEVNLVSDVRLKRYIRDYLGSKGYEIFVTKVDGETVDATERLQILLGRDKLKSLSPEDVEQILDRLIDVRLFGATMPIKAQDEGGRGASSTFTGPVQFNWGYSLNKVELVRSNSITSMFAGRSGEGKGEYGTFGKDWRLYYSLIAFYGIVSGYRAQYTRLSEEDVRLLDDALWNAIPLMASTRSKIGQKPRLLMRVEYRDSYTFLGDPRGKISIEPAEGLRDVYDFEVDISLLVDFLAQNKDKIARILVLEDPDLRIKQGSLQGELQKALGGAVQVVSSL